MTLKKLLNKVIDKNSLAQVIVHLKDQYYPDIPDEDIGQMAASYASTCAELVQCKSVKSHMNKIIICEREDDLVDPPEKYTDVRLSNTDETEIYATDLTLWDSLVDLQIDKQLDITDEEALAHILYDITFYGYTQDDIKLAKNKLQDQIDRIDSGEEKLIPWEDVVKEFEELEQEDKDQ